MQVCMHVCSCLGDILLRVVTDVGVFAADLQLSAGRCTAAASSQSNKLRAYNFICV